MRAITDHEIVEYLTGLIMAHEGGRNVTLGYDDATFNYVLCINGKCLSVNYNFRDMIASAIDEETASGL